MSTADKLNYLNETKEAIKTALVEKGVSVSDSDTFRSYADKIGEISSGGSGGSATKYGLSMDNILGNVDENGVLQAPAKGNLNFVGVKDIHEKGLYERFRNQTSIEEVIFPDLLDISGDKGVGYTFYYGGVKSAKFPKLENISGSSACSQMFYYCNELKEVNLSSLKKITGSSACTSMFNRTGLVSVDLSNLTEISNSYCCNNMFSGCTSLTSVNLSKLSKVSGSNACDSMFSSTGLVSVDLSVLTELSGYGCFQSMFRNCKSLVSVDLSSLERITNGNTMAQMFNGCTSLTSFSLPSFNYTNYSTPFGSSSSDYAFKGCTALTEIHFRADMQAKIESWQGYVDKWGATNATIYFDL